MQQPLEVIGETRIVAVLRAPEGSWLVAAADVLVRSGVRAVELALTTPGALEALERYAAAAPEEACLGAGTVLTAAQARAAVAAGARYLVTPSVVPEVIAAGAEAGVPVVAGALTPTEILTAHRAGASVVKVFPATVFGPSYLRLVHDPLPQIPLVPTGGIGLDDAAGYLAAGAYAVGVGGQLLGDALRGGDLDALARRAEGLVKTLADTGRAR